MKIIALLLMATVIVSGLQLEGGMFAEVIIDFDCAR